MRVYCNAWFARFARKEGLSAQALWDTIERAEVGLIDAELGSGVIKQRIARSGGGKSNGFRSIVFYKHRDRAFFVYGFSKSTRQNIRDDELEQFKKAAKLVFSFSDDQIAQLIEKGQFEEVTKDGQEISK